MNELLCFNPEYFIPGVSKETLQELYPVIYYGSFATTFLALCAIWLSTGYKRPLLVVWGALAFSAVCIYFAQPIICPDNPLPTPFDNISIILGVYMFPHVFCLGVASWLFSSNTRAQSVLMLIPIFTTWQFGLINFG